MAGRWYVVGSYYFEYEAQFVRAMLALEGVRAEVADAQFVGWAWQYAGAVGGAKSNGTIPEAVLLQTPFHHFPRNHELLCQITGNDQTHGIRIGLQHKPSLSRRLNGFRER